MGLPGAERNPVIIQGGMGVGVSNWVLAHAVSMAGHLGVVSGTGVDTLFVRRLQDGDPGGHLRKAMEHFPIPGVAARILEKYFLPDGRPEGGKYALMPMYNCKVSQDRDLVTIVANFVEVFLARRGHNGLVGVNLLTKIQAPTLPSLYGAMLAGVHYVLMGAGIPKEIPGALDRMAGQQSAALRLEVVGAAQGEVTNLTFEPRAFWPDGPATIPRPKFLAIVASNSLATMLSRKASGKVDGFVVEGPTAGGHNAPPRGEPVYNQRGEPLYGARDVVDYAAMGTLGVPFWIAGGAGSPGGLEAALAAGAAGIQVGTLFAFCNESGLLDEYKQAVLRDARAGTLDVITDPRASPTGYPFKVVDAKGIASVGAERERCCDLGYLRTAYKREDGRLAYRCASEPIDTFLKKGGTLEETVGRKCLCNALMANLGHGQIRENGEAERPLLTSGDEVKNIACFLGGRERYSAQDVLDYLLSGVHLEPSIAAEQLPAIHG